MLRRHGQYAILYQGFHSKHSDTIPWKMAVCPLILTLGKWKSALEKIQCTLLFCPKTGTKICPKFSPNIAPCCPRTLSELPQNQHQTAPKPHQKPETSYLRHDFAAVTGWVRVRGDDGERGRNGSVGRMGKMGNRRVGNDVLRRITDGVKILGQTTVFRGIRTKYFRLIPAFFGIMRNYSEKMRGCAAF